MSPAFDAVLFDFRGTLFGIEDDTTWVKNAAATIGRTITVDEAATICRHLDETLAARPDLRDGLDRSDVSFEIHREANLAWFAAASVDPELAHAIWARDADAPEANFPFPETETVMRALHEHGVRVAVVSDIHYDIREHFRRHDLDQYVDAYVLSFEHGCQKPDAEVYTRALDALGVPAARALMVGDRASHDGAAAAVGIATYIFAAPFGSGASGPLGLEAVLRLAGL